MNDPNPWLSLSLGCVGAGLGVFNAWRAWYRDRVSLHLDIVFYILETGQRGLQVTVRNVGHVDAVVEGLGLQLRDGDVHRQVASFATGLTLPAPVGSKESRSFLFNPEVRDSPVMAKVRRAVVETQCGRVFYGTSRSLKDAIRDARNKADAR
jgi:hypothetical protein